MIISKFDNYIQISDLDKYGNGVVENLKFLFEQYRYCYAYENSEVWVCFEINQQVKEISADFPETANKFYAFYFKSFLECGEGYAYFYEDEMELDKRWILGKDVVLRLFKTKDELDDYMVLERKL